MIVYVGNLIESAKNPQEIISEFSKMAGYKINIE